jgi:nucleotide sugar dehydrogenase
VKITVVGVGHVGLVSAACFARWGHDVVGMDDDARKIETLQSGDMPFYEPDLPELVAEGVAAGRLTFTTDIAEALAGAEVVFVCVGTPPLPGGGPNLSYVEAVGRNVATYAAHPVVLVEKSTVPANTGARLTQVIEREQAGLDQPIAIDVASNPEFLREGAAVHDTLHPDRIVYGTASDRAREALRKVYEVVVREDGCPVVETDVPTAELIKHASNAFLATKISFINAVAQVCERVGADVDRVADGMGFDQRIGRQFLYAGLGYGGSCLLGDETVLARRGGRARHVSLADLWSRISDEGVDGWEVLSWHPDRRVPEFLPLSAATLRPYRGDVVEVRTRMGRRLRCTADHPFVVGDASGAGTEVRLARDLTTSDWLPLAGARAPTTEAVPATVSVLAAVGAGAVSASDVIQRLDASDLGTVRERAAAVPAPRRYDVLRNGTIRLERLPDLVWEAPVEHKRALLRGLWDGDGSWSLVNGGPSVVLDYGTVSRPLADGMLRLLGDLGVVASLRVGRTPSSTVDTYGLRISGADQVDAVAPWLFPGDEAAEILASVGKQRKRIAPTGYRVLDDGSTWVRVTGAERRHYEGPVYSLEVPGAHTIVATGGLVTHNCFPKDVDAFIHLSRQVGYEFRLLEEVERINVGQRGVVLDKLRTELWHLTEKTVTLLGAAFKPGTDDLREAPAIHLARELLAEGATVRIYDPVALPNVKQELPEVELFDDPLEALQGAHAAVVTTEWDEVKAIAPAAFREALAYPIVIDGRNALDGGALAAEGIHYHAIGKPAPQVRR